LSQVNATPRLYNKIFAGIQTVRDEIVGVIECLGYCSSTLAIYTQSAGSPLNTLQSIYLGNRG
jgi:hypothetical protein